MYGGSLPLAFWETRLSICQVYYSFLSESVEVNHALEYRYVQAEDYDVKISSTKFEKIGLTINSNLRVILYGQNYTRSRLRLYEGLGKVNLSLIIRDVLPGTSSLELYSTIDLLQTLKVDIEDIIINGISISLVVGSWAFRP